MVRVANRSMRTMGLDVGTKTIGVAASDELGLTAQSITTIRRVGPKKDALEVKRLAEEKEVTRIIIGLPLNMDGTEGPRAKASREFGDALAKETGLPIEYQDERLSTVEAERVLLAGDVSRKKRKAVIDQLAASIILQGWLDAHRPAETAE